MLLLHLTCFRLHNGRLCPPAPRCSLAETGLELLTSACIVEFFACQLVSCYVCSRQSVPQCPDSRVEERRLYLSTQAATHSSSNIEAPAPHRLYPAKVASWQVLTPCSCEKRSVHFTLCRSCGSICRKHAVVQLVCCFPCFPCLTKTQTFADQRR